MRCAERIHELVPPPLLTELHCRCSQDAIYTSERMADLYKRMEGTPLRNQTQWRGYPCAIRLKTSLYKRMNLDVLHEM